MPLPSAAVISELEMTPEEAVYELYDMPAKGDAEAQHGRADEILCKVLERLGYGDVATAFRSAQERCGFWYA